MSRKILVTGGTGFLGRVVCQRAGEMQSGAEIVSVGGQWDLTDPNTAKQLFDVVSPDVVIHLAAKCGGIGANQKDGYRYAIDNTRMAVNVVDQCVRHECALVAVGSVCSYPADATAPFREEDMWNGYPEKTNAPYGLAKRMLITLAQAAGIPHQTVVPTNLYGPGDNFNAETSHVIPALIRKAIDATRTGGPMVVWGTGKATRDFLHVDDAARGIVLAVDLARDDIPSMVINLGSGRETPIRWIASEIAAEVGYKGHIVYDDRRPDGQARRLLDTKRAEQWLRWSPRVDLAAGVKETIAWWRTMDGV